MPMTWRAIHACLLLKEELAAKNKYKAPEIKFNNAVTGGSSAADGSASAAKVGLGLLADIARHVLGCHIT